MLILANYIITCHRASLAIKTSVQRIDKHAFKLYVTLLIDSNTKTKLEAHTNIAKNRP